MDNLDGDPPEAAAKSGGAFELIECGLPSLAIAASGPRRATASPATLTAYGRLLPEEADRTTLLAAQGAAEMVEAYLAVHASAIENRAVRDKRQASGDASS